jgi:hypothetical protein
VIAINAYGNKLFIGKYDNKNIGFTRFRANNLDNLEMRDNDMRSKNWFDADQFSSDITSIKNQPTTIKE